MGNDTEQPAIHCRSKYCNSGKLACIAFVQWATQLVDLLIRPAFTNARYQPQLSLCVWACVVCCDDDTHAYTLHNFFFFQRSQCTLANVQMVDGLKESKTSYVNKGVLCRVYGQKKFFLVVHNTPFINWKIWPCRNLRKNNRKRDDRKVCKPDIERREAKRVWLEENTHFTHHTVFVLTFLLFLSTYTHSTRILIHAHIRSLSHSDWHRHQSSQLDSFSLDIACLSFSLWDPLCFF